MTIAIAMTMRMDGADVDNEDQGMHYSANDGLTHIYAHRNVNREDNRQGKRDSYNNKTRRLWLSLLRRQQQRRVQFLQRKRPVLCPRRPPRTRLEALLQPPRRWRPWQ